MIEADNLADRFGRARQQTSQVCATGERARERHDGPVKCIPASAVLAADPDDGIRRRHCLYLVHHAPHGFAVTDDTVKMELAPVLGFQIHVFHDPSSFSQPTTPPATPRLAATSCGALPDTWSLCNDFCPAPTLHRRG